jgi:hypothetical protein
MSAAQDAAKRCLRNHRMPRALEMRARVESARAVGEGLGFAFCVTSLSKECSFGALAVVRRVECG